MEEWEVTVSRTASAVCICSTLTYGKEITCASVLQRFFFWTVLFGSPQKKYAHGQPQATRAIAEKQEQACWTKLKELPAGKFVQGGFYLHRNGILNFRLKGNN